MNWFKDDCSICKDHGRDECPWHRKAPLDVQIYAVIITWLLVFIALAIPTAINYALSYLGY